MDVTINKPFKDHLRNAYNIWISNSTNFTTFGIKRKPSWQETVDMIDEASKAIKDNSIRSSFRHCGFNFDDQPTILQYKQYMNHKLRDIITFNSDAETQSMLELKIKLLPYTHHKLVDRSDFVQPFEEEERHSARYPHPSVYDEAIEAVVQSAYELEAADVQRVIVTGNNVTYTCL